MLEIKNLSAGYKSGDILSEISFTIGDGSFRAILGKNGSGKSTFAKCLAQSVRYRGKLLLDGEDIAEMTPNRRSRSIAILPQTLPIPPLTVNETIALGRSPYTGLSGRLGKRDYERIGEVSALCGVDGMSDRLIGELSGGERQRAFLAMALAQDTPYLMLDEPTTYMDIAYEAAFMKLLSDLMKTSNIRAMIVIAHDLSTVIKYVTDVTIFDGGKIAFDGKIKDCLDTESIERVFGVRRCQTNTGEIFFTA